MPWAAANTLFAVWFGVVDLALMLERSGEDGDQTISTNDIPDITQHLMTSYANTLDTLYHFGARRFLILNCPPLELMPGGLRTELAIAMVNGYNQLLGDVQKHFLAQHSTDVEAEMYLFDVHALLADIIADPSITVQTKGLKNTTDNCWNYNP